jgi:hypothetical protein
MKIFVYLAYRILNLLATKIFVKKNNAPLLWSKGNIGSANRGIFFDFSHNTTHLGDRLFFIPLIEMLHSAGYELLFSPNDKITQPLFDGILRVPLSFKAAEEDFDGLTIMPLPSLLSRYKRHAALLAVDFSDVSCNLSIAQQLVTSVCLELGIEIQETYPLAVRESEPSDLIKTGEESMFFIFSNYIDSGRFRKFFLDEEVLFRKARELKSLGYRIIHVGSAQDKANDKRHYDFIDMDLRGKLRIADIPKFVNDPRIRGVVSYDNVFMHLAGLFDKPAFVLFRGRLRQSIYHHHMGHVNNAFFKNSTHLKYLI